MIEPRTELDAARMMIAGELPSPTRYGSMTLFAMRVSGTGLAYRSKLEEHVWRDPSIYLNDEFLARIGGLPVVWEHPERTDLTSAEFSDRVIGSVMLPYIKGEDVWAICRIFDQPAIEAMEAGQLSTSPGVHFKPTDGNEKIDMGNGKTLLIEGNPFYVEHLAVCAQGVWDKSRPPTGVQSDDLVMESLSAATERADSMAEKDETAEARKKEDAEKEARRDAAIDKLLSHLDSMRSSMDSVQSRVDAMEMADKARRDAEEKERKEREDSARRDAKARRDAEREEWMKEDAEGCKAEDAVEEKEKEELRGKGETEEVAADKARKDRKARRDKARKDAEEKEKEEEEERKKKDAAREDSDTEAALLRRIAALEAIARPVTDEDRTRLADIQARADSTYMALGDKAPEPMRGETPQAYRIRVLRPMQKHSKSWKDKNLAALPSDALDVIEPQIYADADAAARAPDDVPSGQLVERYKVNPQTGLRTTTFVGRGTFLAGMGQAGRIAILNRSQGRA